MDDVLFALGLTLFAGLSTGIGSALAFFAKGYNPKFLAGALGFSAGVMIYVSMIEIFFKAKDSLVDEFGGRSGYIYTVIAFFAGIALIGIIDHFVPSFENPHEVKDPSDMRRNGIFDKKNSYTLFDFHKIPCIIDLKRITICFRYYYRE